MRKKVCFAASSGGHFEQLSMLFPLMEKVDFCIVTDNMEYCPIINNKKINYLLPVNRKELLMPILLVINFFISLRIILKENPDIVISTGALSVIPLCLLAKLFGKKLVFIETFARVTNPSKTGLFLYKYADRFYIQWEALKEFYPDAIYLGEIY